MIGRMIHRLNSIPKRSLNEIDFYFERQQKAQKTMFCWSLAAKQDCTFRKNSIVELSKQERVKGDLFFEDLVEAI